jgi:DNA-binding NarL/FixJ family response regulator
MTPKKRILIIEDNPELSEELSFLINQEVDIEACFNTNSGNLTALIQLLSLDLVIIDLGLNRRNGIDVIKEIENNFNNFPIIVLSTNDDSLYAEMIFSLGCKGYVMKHECSGKIITAIRNVLDGKIYINEKVLKNMIIKAVG